MAGNQENAPVMQQSYSSGTDTSKSSLSNNKKRKAQVLMPEPPAPREVNGYMVKLQFEKKLTHSDVEGHRILIPKAYAEMVFPETATDDIHYFMDDMAAAKVWTFLIRSWSKGASKIYVLEGAAKYIQQNGIKVGDYIRIYKDRAIERFAIGWRKHGEEIDKSLADVMEKVYLPVTNSEVAFAEKNALPAASSEVAFAETNAFPAASSAVAFADDYHPTFAPDDETYNQFTSDIIDPEYVQKNFNMSWDEFDQDFNPFDFP
ncbi:TF-B3 domain-containing protein [Heracleum sosnowskyi]|uniref:TF-B3 domain-containing protein n=1 Tax=Heracleum sosnowskyi TaxID=360622 RepID=A0AAD8JJG5_9APIA|nr:TF-B3 domain-containing protein [Heracleum sosnowskyi]